MLTPPTLVNNMPFYAKSAGHVTRPYQGISLPKSKYPGYEVAALLPRSLPPGLCLWYCVRGLVRVLRVVCSHPPQSHWVFAMAQVVSLGFS